MEGGGGGGNRSSKISDVEKHHPRASQTLKGYQSTEGISKRNAYFNLFWAIFTLNEVQWIIKYISHK